MTRGITSPAVVFPCASVDPLERLPRVHAEFDDRFLQDLLAAFSIALALALPLQAQPLRTQSAPRTLTEFGKAAYAESAKPVHPGIPGARPFWNTYAKRFIYAPAFEFEPVAGVATYRFTAISGANQQTYTFEAEQPWAPLSPIWLQLPFGTITLTVEALAQAGGESLGLVGEREFMKSPPFNGPYGEAAFDFAASARRCLEDLLHQRKLQNWLTTGQPDSTYPLWVHPTKIIGGVMSGTVIYAELAPPHEAQDALRVAQIAADFLLALREPPGRPLEFWPPSYWDGVPRGNHPIYMDQMMSHNPAEGAMAYLDLFDAIGERTYFDAALRIADTYVRLQQPDGTWPQLVYRNSGEAVKPVRLVPLAFIELCDRLDLQYGETRYRSARQRAWQWCFENPIRTFNWQAQYEDTRPKALYRNLSHREAAIMARLLLASGDADQIALGLELLRFVEDQFVVWEKSDPAVTYPWFRPETVWNANDPETGNDWFVPSVTEQYVFFTPIAGSTSYMIRALLQAYETTRQEIYLAKAVSLANTITIAQQYHGGGDIPTHLRRNLPELNWINVSVMAAKTLLELHEVLQTRRN